jgi:menaquinone-dependent protoporphyrinogen oxidase
MSKHGCTRQAAQLLKDRMSSGDIELIDLKKNKPSLDDYDCVVIGGSIHAGSVQKRIHDFCIQNLEILKQKKVGLYLCCMKEGKEAKEQFENAFPEELRNHSSANGLFGGEFNFKKMNFIERFLVKKIAKVDKSVSNLNKDSILKFADVLAMG